MARVLIYNRVVDTMLMDLHTYSVRDAENGRKIKKEPEESMLNSNSSEYHTNKYYNVGKPINSKRKNTESIEQIHDGSSKSKKKQKKQQNFNEIYNDEYTSVFHLNSDAIEYNMTEPQNSESSIDMSDDTSKINKHGKSLYLNNLDKLEAVNITVMNNTNKQEDNVPKTNKSIITELSNNAMSPSKKWRQPTLVEYFEQCKRKHDTTTPNDMNIMTESSSTSTVNYDEQIKESLVPKLIKQKEVRNVEVNSLATKSNNFQRSEYCTLKPSEKHKICSSTKPFVQLHMNIETMKFFLENPTNTNTEDKITKDQTDYTVSSSRYSLRFPRINTSVTTSPSLEKKRSKSTSERCFNIECSTKTKNGLTNLHKRDYKDCTISLTRCDKNSKINHLSPTFKPKQDAQCNSTSLQEKDANNIPFKELEIRLERSVDVKTVSDDKNLFFCKICEQNFSSKLARHMHIKSSHIAYMSSICNARYTHKHQLLQHYLREHLFEHNRCCICYELLVDYSALKRHLYIHCLKYIQRKSDQHPVNTEIRCSLIRKSNKCSVCGKIFSSQFGLIHCNCLLQKELQEAQRDFLADTNNVIVARDEEVHNNNTNMSSNNGFVNNLRETQTSANAKKLNISEDNRNASVIAKKTEIISQSKDFEKTLKDNNPAINDQIDTLKNIRKTENNFYSCDICGQRFKKKRNLEQHMRMFDCSNYAKCILCNTKFSSKRFLNSHISATHTSQVSQIYNFHCMFCNQGFTKKYKLRSHVLHLHGQQIFEKFSYNAQMDQDDLDEVFNHTLCNICNIIFKTYDRYIEHKMYYYKGYKFTCSLCEQDFHGMHMLHHHNKLMHYPEDKRKSYTHICDMCNEGFNHESHFYSHKMHVHLTELNSTEITEESEDKNQFDNVLIAQEETEIKNTLTNPQEEAKPTSSHTCEICKLKFANVDDMAKHKTSVCNRKCETLDLPEQQKKIAHISPNKHITPIANDISITVTSPKSNEKYLHLDDVIEETNNYICEKCGHKFSSNIAYEKHQCKFNDENNIKYNCLFCDMKFTSLSTVQMHVSCAHLNDILAKRASSKSNSSSNDDTQKRSVQQVVEKDLTKSHQLYNNVSSNTNEANDGTIGNDGIIVKPSNIKTLSSEHDNSMPIIKLPNSQKETNINIPVVIVETNSKPTVNSSSSKTSRLINISQVKSIIPLKSRLVKNFETNLTIPSSIGSANEFNINTVKLLSTTPTKTSKLITVVPSIRKMNETDDGRTTNNYKCPICPLQYPSLMFLYAHMKFVHANFVQITVANIKLDQSTQNSIIQIKCLLCHRIFTKDIDYRSHLRSFHAHDILYPKQARRTDNTKVISNNPPTNVNTITEVITLEDIDDDIEDDIENFATTHSVTEAASVVVPNKENKNINKLKVKPFANIVENLSIQNVLKLLHTKNIIFH